MLLTIGAVGGGERSTCPYDATAREMKKNIKKNRAHTLQETLPR
jgi:hypothetical protein